MFDKVLALLPGAACDLLEAMMTMGTFEYKSDFARRYFRQGEATGELKGTTRMLLAVLFARGVDVTEEAHARITECNDLEILEAWARCAATAGSVDDVFG